MLTASLDAHRKLRAARGLCSWTHGWRSILLREYVDQPHEERFTTAATPDPLFVLVVEGSCHIESLLKGQWRSAHYGVGSLAMTPPGVESTLRWRSTESHRTLQLHLPFEQLTRQSQELWDRDVNRSALPAVLSGQDHLIGATMLALRDGMKQGLPDLYAANAAELLGVHFLLRHCKRGALPERGRDDRRLLRVVDFMRANLGANVSLEDLAHTAGLSRFHLLRLFKKHYGETPLQCLTRLRMEAATNHLKTGRLPIHEIAAACGYPNPGNFAVAFRRFAGIAPRELLAKRRSRRPLWHDAARS
jgi:AraC family transcriptional regulator